MKVLFLIGSVASLAAGVVANATGFPLVTDGEVVSLRLDGAPASPVARASLDLVADIARVVGEPPVVLTAWPRDGRSLIVVGELGTGGAIDELVAANRFDAAELEGAWESFLIEEIDSEGLGADRILVVAGSDPRGTIYGIYEISRAIGVSPWAWWADVPVKHDPAVTIPAERQRFGPPAVKYRGIFINDEDWALLPWAAKTFDPEFGDLGPRTYAKVFELLLRLRANCLWPAMHKVSRPFNEDRRNAALAHTYGIVMGSSHAEPLLRNNVREWTAPHEHYNFRTHREDVVAYWEERLRANGEFENIYTLGMRGIHDSGMQGGASVAERVALLESIFAVQRELLREHVDPAVAALPQIFVAYKEVLELYRAGLEVPGDVTIVWPDDNHGYIRDFATADEAAAREGGFGVYYHISYLGRPMAYLWLNSTPPALIWEEMAKAYAHGADRFWMLNVGDLKPGEIGMDFFFDLAWDVDAWGPDAQPRFLQAWAARTFGPGLATEIAALLAGYYRLNFARKPEHLQFYTPLQAPALSPWPEAEIEARLDAFAALEAEVESVGARVAPSFHDAFFQLVGYPVKASAAANRRYFWTERYRREPTVAAAREAWAAEDALQALTRFYNEDLADGKWRRFMALEPADRDWRSMRIAPLELPPRHGEGEDPTSAPIVTERSASPVWTATAAQFRARTGAEAAAWVEVPGLGRSGNAMTVLPFTGKMPTEEASPTLSYSCTVPAEGSYVLTIELLPTFALEAGGPLRLAVSLDEGPRRLLTLDRVVGAPGWSEGVLAGFVPLETTLELKAGAHTLWLHAVDRGVVVDRLTLRGGVREIP